MNMVRSRLLSRNSLSSTIIGVVPLEPGDVDVGLLVLHHAFGSIVHLFTYFTYPK